MPVVFYIDNGTNFVLFLKVASALKRDCAARVVFVTLIQSRVALFESHGFEAIYLDLSSARQKKPCNDTSQRIARIEERFSDFRLELGISQDRILRHFPRKKALGILLTAAKDFFDFVERYRPQLILGEVSWAIEYLFYYISADQGIRYRHILNVPGENLRITAFDDRHTLASALEASPSNDAALPIVDKSYAELCGDVKGFRSTTRYFLSNFRLNYSRNDYRQFLFYRLRRPFFPIYKVLDRFFYRMFSAQAPSNPGTDILFMLHIQPEATPDFVSPFYADQLALAHRLVRAMRSDQSLYIKDHPNTISLRNLLGWARLARHPRVRFLRRNVSGQDLYPRFGCVVSIAGTALAECSQLGVPALCFSDCYFREFPGVIDARQYASLSAALSAAIELRAESETQTKLTNVRFSKIGFPGFIHDARVSPGVLDPTNIASIVTLVKHLLAKSYDPVYAIKSDFDS